MNQLRGAGWFFEQKIGLLEAERRIRDVVRPGLEKALDTNVQRFWFMYRKHIESIAGDVKKWFGKQTADEELRGQCLYGLYEICEYEHRDACGLAGLEALKKTCYRMYIRLADAHLYIVDVHLERVLETMSGIQAAREAFEAAVAGAATAGGRAAKGEIDGLLDAVMEDVDELVKVLEQARTSTPAAALEASGERNSSVNVLEQEKMGEKANVHASLEDIKEKGWGGMSVEVAGGVAAAMTAYTQLAQEEKTRLEMSGSDMFHSLDSLVVHVRFKGKEQEKYGLCFAQALATAHAIREELLNEKKRQYVYAPERYSTARANLDEGVRLLSAVQGFERMKADATDCQGKMDVYAEVWRKILEFDSTHTNPYFQRTVRRIHAFSKEHEASMEEMLRELNVLSVGDT